MKINAPNLSVIKDEVKLGSREASQPVVLGDELIKILEDIISILTIVPLAIDNTQTPLGTKKPIEAGKITTLSARIKNILSKKVKTI